MPACGRNKHLLEAELRSREMQFRELLDDYDRVQHHNHAIEHELAAMRQGWAPPPEVAAHTVTVQKITLGRMTGGTDIDGCYGDDGLLVVVEPRDCENQTLKAPGSLHIMALAVDPHGLKAPVGTWDVPPDQLRYTWKQGLLSNGYSVTVPFQVPPMTENVRVAVRLVMPDGRTFETDKDVKVKLAARHQRPGIAPDGPMVVPPSMGPRGMGPAIGPPPPIAPPGTPQDTPIFMPRPAPDAMPAPAPPGPEQSLRSAIRVNRPVPVNP
ncbi:MAG: hypothetical protein FJ271_24810 [Planctomycetes bacterium]|nr:hypothetical protein [Planctomycetota bacterium]